MAPVARNSLVTVALFGAMVAALTSIAQDGNQPERSPGESFRAKQLLGSSVVLEGDKSVGTIDDIVLDVDGNVDCLIVANKGKLLTVPWDAVKFNAEKRSTLLQITPERFQQIPTYAPNHSPHSQHPGIATKCISTTT